MKTKTPHAITARQGPGLPWHAGQILVLHALHLARRASRAELAAMTGLSPQSLSRITQELVSIGYVRELKRRHTGGLGQPAIELGLEAGCIMSLGLVLEHDRITCVSADLASGIVNREEMKGDFLSASRSVGMAERLVADAIKILPPNITLLGLGVSQSGFFFDPAMRRIINRGDPQGWAAFDLMERLGERFGIDVVVENDGRAAAAGHLIHGIGTQFRNFFVILMTRGVGGGGVMERRLLRGHAGNAGEVAILMPPDVRAIRPTTESLENTLRKAWGKTPTALAIETAVAIGDKALTSWLDEAARVLEIALVGVCTFVDPEAIILAGRLPITVRRALAARLNLSAPAIGQFGAPIPQIIVDPASDCLEIGAAALPVTHFFARHVDRIGAL